MDKGTAALKVAYDGNRLAPLSTRSTSERTMKKKEKEERSCYIGDDGQQQIYSRREIEK